MVANERAPAIDPAEGSTPTQALCETVSRQRLALAKRAFNTRRVDLALARRLLSGAIAPRAGDLLLAQVSAIGQHRFIELPDGRRARLFVGDEVIVCFGNRYAPDQFEVVVPDSLQPCALAASGGLAGALLSQHAAMRKPTRITPLGLLADRQGKVLNVRDFALPDVERLPTRKPRVVAVLGTSMNAGKTTTAAALINGLRGAGLRVAAAKVTGTGSGADIWHMIDAGASPVLDFTDAGLVSTWRVGAAELRRTFHTLMAHLVEAAPDAMVIEVADGLLQEETAALIRSETFHAWVDTVIFAAPDAISATAGVAMLRELRLPVVAISGVLSASVLASNEAVRASGLEVLTLNMLSDPDAIAPRIFALPARAAAGGLV